MMITVIVRVLKKHGYSKTLMFMDVVYADEKNSEYTFASLVFKSENLSCLSGVIAGHVLQLTGEIQNLSAVESGIERPSILTNPEDVSILDPWKLQENGFFSFEPIHVTPHRNYSAGHPITCKFPLLSIQVKHKSCERLIQVLKDKFLSQGIHSLEVRESSTCYIKSDDRLLIISEAVSTDLKFESKLTFQFYDLMNTLIRDPVISPYIMRVYSGVDHLSTVVPSICSASLQIAYEQLMQSVLVHNESLHVSSENEKIQKIRLHSFPKGINRQLLDIPLPFEIQWSPTDYDYILSTTLIDGLWLCSLMKKEKMYIGDLREKKINPKIRVNDPRNASNNSPATTKITEGTEGQKMDNIDDTICRAAAKIEECMQRFDWIYENSHSSEPSKTFRKYQFAIDIGASPGGWTSFLSRSIDVEAILSVDKGELALPIPWPPQILYWPIHGEEAIERLHHLFSVDSNNSEIIPLLLLNKRIDLFCCDANISPYKSIQFLWKALEYQLLATTGRFIITFKNIFGRKVEWEMAIKDCFEKVNQPPFHNVEMVHLLANTPKEVTIIGYYTLSVGEQLSKSYK